MNPFLLILSGATWGLHFALMRVVGGDHLSPMITLFPLLIGVAACLFLVTLVWHRPTGSIIPHIRFFLISGCLGYLIPYFLELTVAPNMSTALLTFVITTTPLMTILMAGLIRSEIANRRHWIAVGLGLAATTLLFLAPDAIPDAGMIGWTLLAFAIPAVYAAQTLYIVHAWPDGFSPLHVAAWESLVAAVLGLPLFLYAVDGEAIATLADGSGLIGLTIIVTAVEVVAFFALTRRAGAIYVSFTAFTALVAGIIWGFLMFDEIPSLAMWMCCLLIGLSLFVLGTGRTVTKGMESV